MMGPFTGQPTTIVSTDSSGSYVFNGSTSSPMPHTCPPKNWPAERLSVYKWEVGMLSAIFALAMIGNLCVILAVWRRRAKHTRMHLFIVHLAVADIIVALFEVLPELLIRLQCGFWASDFLCRIVKYLQIVGMYGSTYVLVCTALDRYLAIRYPMQTFKLSKKRVHLAISCAWVLSLLLSIPQLIVFGLKKEGRCGTIGVTDMFMKIYVTWYFFSVLLLPSCMLGFFYGMIAVIIIKNVKQKRKAVTDDRAVRNPRNNAGEFAPRASNVKIVSRAKIKTVRMTFVIVILFVICFTPFFFAQLLGIWGAINRQNRVSAILHLLASLNSCVNPWVYMGFSGHLLGELKSALLCGSERCGKKKPQVRSFRSTMVTNTAGSSVMYAETSQHEVPLKSSVTINEPILQHSNNMTASSPTDDEPTADSLISIHD